MSDILRLNGVLSQFKVPEFKLIFPPINGTYKACIDTGSYYSIIHPEIIQLARFSPTHKVKYQHPTEGLKEDKPAFELTFMFDGYLNEFKEVFSLFETEYQYEVILGAKFLSQCKEFHYFGQENRFELII